MGRVVFYCNDQRSRINDTEYYRQDLDALSALGHDVTLCTRYREIPGQFDLMYVWWWTYALWPVLLARAKGKPAIITGVFNFRFPETFDGVDYFKRPRWQRLLIREAAQRCTTNLFVDQGELAACGRHFDLRDARHFPCVLHDDYLAGPSPDPRPILFNVAWSGRQNLVRKGIPELLEAIHLLKARGVAVNLTLAGHEGDGTPFLLETIERLGLGAEVSCIGAVSRADKIARLRASEIYVQPSHYEGFGVAIAEAMGCGACVVACDVGAVRSVVGDAGIYVRPGDPAGLADAIQLALEDEPLRHRLQRAAHERACRLFRADRKVAALRRCLHDLGIS